MGKYGVKIKNISAGTLYEYNLGVRDNYKYKTAMFTNSLLYDFLLDNGLSVWKEESTRDIICLEFNWGSRSYEEEIKHLNSLEKKHCGDSEFVEKLNIIREKATKNQEKYKKRSKEQIRCEYYENGVSLDYETRDRHGNLKHVETIHYKMIYRTTGKAKKGSCMFIRDELYDKTYEFLSMGLRLPENDAPIVELSAYMPLVTSTIIDKVKINPKNILILEDVDSFFKTKVVSVETDENKQCVAKTIDDYMLKNTLFDGQALLDSSIFPKWADGYVLLRHHFCKMASFSANIQKFFKDYFGKDYMTAKVTDIFGNEHFAKDIELITTNNAMKWIKFDVSYEYWCEKVYENNCMFGIVKTAHKSKLGEMQKMSYQMINALDCDAMEEIAKPSIDYIVQLKTNNDVFLEYLKQNSNFSNDYEVLVALVEQNRDFLRSEYFRKRKELIIRNYTLKLKSGKIIQNADNLVIIGSPYAMLLHSVGEDVNNDDTFYSEDGVIQCYTKRFENDEYLAAFRSPFNSKNNMVYLHNVYTEKMGQYFNFGEQVIAVNLINTDLQDRCNGADQDSDSLYTTNYKKIVECAKQYYLDYPTIVNNIQKEKKSYSNHPSQYALLDNNLAMSSSIIGESSNLAQVALTYTYNFPDKKYQDCVCILSVLAQVAIDNSKRKFDINLDKEIKRFKKLLEIEKNKFPEFWQIIRPDFNKRRINQALKCPMNYLYSVNIGKFRDKESTLPMSHFFMKFELEENRRKNKKVEELIEQYSLNLMEYNTDQENEEYLLLRNDFEELVDSIKKIHISKNYIGLMSWLIDRAFLISDDVNRNKLIQSKLNMNKSILIKTLFTINSNNLLKVFSKNG